jgi:hypothetical protein
MRLYSIHTGYYKLDGGAMFGVVPKYGFPKPLRRRGLSVLLLKMFYNNQDFKKSNPGTLLWRAGKLYETLLNKYRLF